VYLQNNARFTSDCGTTKQIEACGLGETDLDQGYRQNESGIALSVNRATPNYLRSAAGGVGESLSSSVHSQLSLDFDKGGVTTC
jgi:hypothetical protein